MSDHDEDDELLDHVPETKDEEQPDPKRIIGPLMYENPEWPVYRRKKYWEDD